MYTANDWIMKRPASTYCHRWRDSTPIGTGVTGAMFYGAISKEHIIINRNDLWYGCKDEKVPSVSHTLNEMRELEKQGEYLKAKDIMYNALIENNYDTELGDMRTLGEVLIDFSTAGVYSDYRRVIHLDTAEAEVSCKIDDFKVLRKYLALRKRDIIAVLINTEAETDFIVTSGFFRSNEGGKEDIVRENDKLNEKYRNENGVYIYSSKNEGKYFGIACRIITDGELENCTHVKNSKKSLVLIKAFSKEENRDEAEDKAVKALLDCPENYDELYKENLPFYQKLFNTANVKLYNGEIHSNEELISTAKDKSVTPELMERLWRFGRYLFISGTRENALPFALYGLWVGGYNCEFTHNVANENAQSIYWHTELGGLSVLNEALIDYYVNKMDTFRENARNLYNCRGIFVGTYTTPENSAVAWYLPVILHFLGAAGWISQHFYNYYLHTKNEKVFEEKILPFMLETAEFYEDYYYTDEDGKLVLYPAVSPENSPNEYWDRTQGFSMVVAKNPTIEIAILKELLTNLIEVSKVRKELSEKAERWRKMLDIIPSYRINDDGAIAEWIPKVHSDAYDHRHFSHLYPVFPGREVNDVQCGHLLPYFKCATDLRDIRSCCGWSLPNMSALYSRFCDDKKSLYCINAFAKSCLLDNFFTTGHDYRDMGIAGFGYSDEFHSSVQLDALMGSVNAVQEMLIYTSKDFVKILPACPEEFNEGEMKLYFFDGVADIKWNLNKKKCHGTLTASRDTSFKLKLPFEGKIYEVSLKSGEEYTF